MRTQKQKGLWLLGGLFLPLVIGEAHGTRHQQAAEDGAGGFKVKALTHLAPHAYWDETGAEEVQNIAQGLAHFRQALVKNQEAFTEAQKIAAWKLYLLFRDQPSFVAFVAPQAELPDLEIKSTWGIEDFGLAAGSNVCLGLWELKHKWQRAYVPAFDEVSVQPFMGGYTAGLFWYLKRPSPLAVSLSSLSALGLGVYGLTSYDTRRYVSGLRNRFRQD